MKSQLLKSTSLAALLVCFYTLQPGRVLAATTSTTITGAGVISFGAFVVLPGCSGCSITISPTGVRTVIGAILLSNTNVGSPATFTVSRTCDNGGQNPKCSFATTAVATAVLPAGGVNMSLSAFTFTPVLDGNPPLTNSPSQMSVGATLTIPSQGAAGTFSGGGFTFTTTP